LSNISILRILLSWGINGLYVGFILIATYLFFNCNLIEAAGGDKIMVAGALKTTHITTVTLPSGSEGGHNIHHPTSSKSNEKSFKSSLGSSSSSSSPSIPLFKRLRRKRRRKHYNNKSKTAKAKAGALFSASSLRRSSYAVCEKSWYGLDALDMGFLADMAYDDDITVDHVERKLKRYFDKSSKIIWDAVKVQDSPRHFSVRLTHEDYAREPFHIVSVSGTNKARDVYEDVAIWNEAGVLRLISMLIPVEWWWPSNVVASLAAVASWLFFEPRYVDEMVEKVTELRRAASLPASSSSSSWLYSTTSSSSSSGSSSGNIKAEQQPVIFTGHSLGGGIAAILGAKTHRAESVGFSSPGAAYQSAKFGFSLRDLRLTSTTIYADRDIIPVIDSHAGSVQAVECSATNFRECHSLTKLLCELWRACGKEEVGGVPSDYWDLQCVKASSN